MNVSDKDAGLATIAPLTRLTSPSGVGEDREVPKLGDVESCSRRSGENSLVQGTYSDMRRIA